MKLQGKGMGEIKIIECPRDAMQGWPAQIPTAVKIDYINSLLKVGFDSIDFGSFVSPTAIPQMADTRDVVTKLNLENTSTKLLAITANRRGAEEACGFEQINYLGFPFSISETFQQRNTNSSIDESLKRVEEIQSLCENNRKQLVVYISMGFGNPFGDEYSADVVFRRMKQIESLGVKTISIADTVGLADAQLITNLISRVLPSFAGTEIGVHLHSSPEGREEKLKAALDAGCIRFDSAIKGIGGCPMAGDDLVGNMDTEMMIGYLEKQGRKLHLNKKTLQDAVIKASTVFS